MIKSLKEWILVFTIIGVIMLIGNWIGYDILPWEALPGIAILIGISLAGLIIHRLLPFQLPSIAYIGIIGLILTIPGVPGATQIVTHTTEVTLLAIATPILAYAGVSIGRSWFDFVQLGWKTIVIGMVVLLGTFLGSAVIAEIILRFQGII
ncbi:hypothetical protein A1A1_01508 [Planococcus antarcticus DSM 14505]|uniref:DUF340 domain-containing protein n=1 Tax=Planococcus antarcticus DSM 14505 TaxID=1185653 RepID=A0A1C7DJS0_9BACL|nr:hypothetical protein [Planococcus antarcticus]ANU11677.1 hypothetical protein BBH88_16050 [Planococcus antarcticus DSM 14505]EIM08259.1 hypothetical protein A1A1_01508 [Planococcus antarcticus DSM 14505]